MNSSMKLAAIVALALSAGLAGCMAQPEDTDEDTQAGNDVAAAPAKQADEASDKCGFGLGGFGFGGCGVGLPFNGLGGCWSPGLLFGGFPTPASICLGGFGGFGFFPGFGGFAPGCGAFGACGGCGGFGGCW